MPVPGYYEWQDTPNGKQPWYFTARDGSPLLTIAGLWDQWKNSASMAHEMSRSSCPIGPAGLAARTYNSIEKDAACRSSSVTTMSIRLSRC